MPALVWNPCFETGIAEIDHQHRHLVDLLNRASKQLARIRGGDAEDTDALFTDALLAAIPVYAAEHFATEENLMRAEVLDPRHVEQHHQSHRNCMQEIQEISDAYVADREVCRQKLQAFATHSFIFHMLDEDQTMSRQLRSIHCGQSPQVAFDASGDLTPTPAQAALIRSLSGFRKPPEAWAPKLSIDASEDEAEEKLRRDCQGKGYTLLLADDDPFSRELVQILLDDVGLRVDIAQDGIEALELATRNRYIAILMDVQMPRMDGLEATSRIRQLSEHKHTPILALTADAFADDKNRCLEVGMNDFMSKPFAAKQLYQVILQYLERR
jgi:hemerythrin-like metal-binding protein